MRYSIRSRLTYHFEQPCEVLLLIEAARSPDQRVRSDRLEATGGFTRLDDGGTGERRAVLAAQGRVEIAYNAEVEALGRRAVAPEDPRTALRDLPAEALRYLHGSRYCPADRFERFVERQFGAHAGGAKVLAIVDWIAGHVDYAYGESDTTTTALDTFVRRAGVCRDFAHLTITLCRAAGIPARAMSAYAFGLRPPDLHAVAEVFVGGGWRAVDATGKAPIDGLVRIATGADAADIAFMTIFGAARLESQSFEIETARPEAA